VADETMEHAEGKKTMLICCRSNWLHSPPASAIARVPDPHHLNANPDPAFPFNADPDPAFHFNADPDPASHFTVFRFRFRLWKNFGSSSGPRQYLAQFFNKQKFVRNVAFLCQKQHYFPESWPPILLFIQFYFGSGSKSGSGNGTVMHCGYGSEKAKSYGSCGSGFTTLASKAPF
jgi:hypothetical protein